MCDARALCCVRVRVACFVRLSSPVVVAQNGGNLPLSLIISITRDIEPFASDPTATARGVAYTSITMTYMDILSWGVALNYLRPSTPPPRLEDTDGGDLVALRHYQKLDGDDDGGEDDVRANKSVVSNAGPPETAKDSPGVRFSLHARQHRPRRRFGGWAHQPAQKVQPSCSLSLLGLSNVVVMMMVNTHTAAPSTTWARR
jgi:hypothetical protein